MATAVALLAAALFLFARSATSPVVLSFAGYDADGWATFTLANQTRNSLSHSRPHSCRFRPGLGHFERYACYLHP